MVAGRSRASDGAEPALAQRVRRGTYFGQELVPRPRRLALMNLFLHGLEPEIKLGDSIYEQPADRRFDVVLTNPPFGNKGANQVPARDDLTIKTSNKQLNFLQHVMTLLKPGGRAAVVVPDNCLFADQAGEVFKMLTQECDLHTVLRLPNGTFTPYSAGTKTNVVFFTKGRPTETVWIYDARTNVPRITKKDRPLTHAHLAEFEACYGLDPNGRARRSAGDSREDRWRSFSIAEVRARDFKIDGLKWLKEESLDGRAAGARGAGGGRDRGAGERGGRPRVGDRAADERRRAAAAARRPGGLMTSAVSDWEIGRREGRAAGRLGRGDARGDRRPQARRRVGRGSARGGGEPGAGAGAGDPRHGVPRLGARQGRDGGGAGDQARRASPAASSRWGTWWSRSRAAAPASRWGGRC